MRKNLINYGAAAAMVAASLPINVLAAPASDYNCNRVRSEDTLNNCLTAGYATRLTDDITLTSVVKNSYGIANAAGAIYIPAGVNPVLNLNNHIIKAGSDLAIKVGMINIAHGASLTVNGNGTITTNGGPADKPYAAISLTASGDLQDDTKTASLTVNGGTIEGYYYGIVGNGNEGRGNTNITINGGTVRGIAVDDSIGIFNPQFNSAITINGGTVTGDSTGIEMRSGNLTVNGGTIEGRTATPTTSAPNGSGNTTKGAGIAIAQHNTKQPIAVSITGGEIKGYTAIYESNPQGNADENIDDITVSITGGTFTATNGGTNAVNLLDGDKLGESEATGGTFSSKPEGMTIPEGYTFDENTKRIREDVDLSALEDAITLAESKKEFSYVIIRNYTTESWNNLQTALTAARTARTEATGGFKDAMQTYVDEKTTALNNAINALEGFANKTALIAELAETLPLSVVNLGYSAGSFQNLLDARAAGQALVDAEVGASRQAEVDAATEAIEQAVNDRVNLIELRSTIKQAQDFVSEHSDEYTNASIATLNEIIESAIEVRDNDDLIGESGKQAVTSAIDNITLARKLESEGGSLELKANKEWLNLTVNLVNMATACEDPDVVCIEIKEGSELDSFYKEAQEMLEADLGTSDQEDINTLTENLFNALATKIGNTEAMSNAAALIDQTDSLDSTRYTKQSYSFIPEAYKAVVDFVAEHIDDEDDSKDAYYEELETLNEALETALAGLIEAADTSALEDSIKRAEAVDETLYTEDSLTALSEALEAAKTTLESDLSIDEQSTVDQAAQAIEDAIKNLVKNPVAPDTGVMTASMEATSHNSTGLIATICSLFALVFARCFTRIKARQTRKRNQALHQN